MPQARGADAKRVLLNGAWDRGWRADVGRVVEVNKQLAVDLPAGHHRVRLKYWPVRLTGLWLTGLGLIGVIAFYTRKRWRDRLPRRR